MSVEMVHQRKGTINVVLQEQKEQHISKDKVSHYNDTQLEYVEDCFKRFIGLEKVKNMMKEIYALNVMNNRRITYGMKPNQQVMHMLFRGNPGTGKTTIARQIANVLHDLQILSKGHFIEAERADIVGEFVGQTAQKTKTMIQKAQGGVLFIDEAYSLGRGGSKDFGREAIDNIVKQMEDCYEDFVIILAGYPNEMDHFLHLNPGLRSRFAYEIDFPDYELEQLIQIAKQLVAEREYELSASAELDIRNHLQQVLHQKPAHFSNARYVRNMIEQAIRHQATRLLSIPNQSPSTLKYLNREDISIN